MNENEAQHHTMHWSTNVSALYLARAAGIPMISLNEAHLVEGEESKGTAITWVQERILMTMRMSRVTR